MVKKVQALFRKWLIPQTACERSISFEIFKAREERWTTSGVQPARRERGSRRMFLGEGFSLLFWWAGEGREGERKGDAKKEMRKKDGLWNARGVPKPTELNPTENLFKTTRKLEVRGFDSSWGRRKRHWSATLRAAARGLTGGSGRGFCGPRASSPC